MLLKEKPDFPDKPGEVKTIEVRTGGPAPGIIVKAELTTQVERDGDNTYIITLTKEWKAMINGKQPISFWKYKVEPDNIVLIESEDNDAVISLIR